MPLSRFHDVLSIMYHKYKVLQMVCVRYADSEEEIALRLTSKSMDVATTTAQNPNQEEPAPNPPTPDAPSMPPPQPAPHKQAPFIPKRKQDSFPVDPSLF